MKKALVVSAMVTLLLALISTGASAGLWNVTIKNTCPYPVSIEVTGEHLFWRSVDCSVSVGAGMTETCNMPEGICPTKIELIHGNTISCWGNEGGWVACCFNVNVKAVRDGLTGCKLQKVQ